MSTSPSRQASGDDRPELLARNARTGIWLFSLYSGVYAVFVALSAFWPEQMATPTPLGPNVAIVYGIALIAGAFLLALVYMVLCQRNARLVDEHARRGAKP